MVKPSILIIAGEASADLHGTLIVRSLQTQRPELQLFGIGGQGMCDLGFEAVISARKMAVAGLTEVLSALPRILWYGQKLLREIRRRKPVVALLMDHPDFNLRLAKHLKKLNIPVVYFISPQVWAWRESRVKKIRLLVKRMLVVLPFEVDFYRKHGIDVEFVGHPLAEALKNAHIHYTKASMRQKLQIPEHLTPVVAWLPGSRTKEITRHLPIMLKAIAELKTIYPDAVALLPVASTISKNVIEKKIPHQTSHILLFEHLANEVIGAADVAVVCSGTATLQTALLLRPMVVVYRVSWLTYFILKKLVRVAYIALINLIANKMLVPELVQKEFTVANVVAAIKSILNNGDAQKLFEKNLVELRQQLLNSDVPSADIVAARVLEFVPRSI